MSKQIAEMQVDAANMELPDTKTLRLQWPPGYDPEFKTGQFITLYFADSPAYKRAYSLSSCALDRGFYEVTIKREGKMGTRIVDWVKPGDKMWVIPPTGRFLPVLEPDKHLLCIAGGSGVTPFAPLSAKPPAAASPPKSPSFTASRPPTTSFSTRNSAISNKKTPISNSSSPAPVWRTTIPGRAAVDASGRLGPRAHQRPAQHRFLCLRPQRPGGRRRAPGHRRLKVPKDQMKIEKWGGTGAF